MRLFNNLERVQQFKNTIPETLRKWWRWIGKLWFLQEIENACHEAWWSKQRTSSWKSEFGSLWSWRLVVWSLLTVLDLWTRPRWLESLCWLPREMETRLPHEACHCSSRGTQFACESYQREEMSRIECGHHGNFPLCEPIQEVQDCMSKNVSYRVKVNKFPIGNAYSYIVKKGCSYLCMWMTSNWLERNRNLDPMWKVLNKEVDLGEATFFLDHVYLGALKDNVK